MGPNLPGLYSVRVVGSKRSRVRTAPKQHWCHADLFCFARFYVGRLRKKQGGVKVIFAQVHGMDVSARRRHVDFRAVRGVA